MFKNPEIPSDTNSVNLDPKWPGYTYMHTHAMVDDDEKDASAMVRE